MPTHKKATPKPRAKKASAPPVVKATTAQPEPAPTVIEMVAPTGDVVQIPQASIAPQPQPKVLRSGLPVA